MLICQITDFHLVPAGELAYGVVDTRIALQRAIAAVQALQPAPDLVLITGDLADRADPEPYQFAAAALSELAMPYLIVPGNHDSRALLLAQFPNLRSVDGFVSYTVEQYPLRLIGLDTTLPGTHRPDFCTGRLDWLAATLAETPARPTLLFMHHPPFETGVDAMDFMGLAWAERLADLVRQHPNIVRILCGHHHRAITAGWAGTVVSVAPSVAHQFPSRFGAHTMPALTLEPPGMLLHWWSGAHLVTHLAPIDPAPTTEFFPGDPARWEQMKAAMRAGNHVTVGQA